MEGASLVRTSTLVLVLALAPARGWADVYVWTDAEGNVQMTEDLSRVPAAQRARAIQAGERVERGELSTPAEPSEARPASKSSAPSGLRHAARKSSKPPAGKKHVLRVERAGSEMRVEAVVDGVVVPFILDTGASICSLPRWAAEEMGVTIDADTPMIPVAGISGQTQWVPELEIGSVTVGDAEVSDLNMAVLDTMSEGLLGMPFFNHFRVSTDPTTGTLVLEEIDLEQVDGVAGGLNEAAWRQRFRSRRQSLQEVERKLAQVPDEYITIRERLQKKKEYWENQLEVLDLQATRAGVPQEWRE
jgi:clan AA aspartic protease (TIGR02281 family)